MQIILPSTFWLDFQGSRAFQKACKMVSKMVSKTNKTMQSGYLKKCQNAHIQNNLTIIETLAPGVKIRALKKLVWSPARHRGIAHSNAESFLTLLGPQGLPRASKTRAMPSCSKDVTKPSKRRPQKWGVEGAGTCWKGLAVLEKPHPQQSGIMRLLEKAQNNQSRNIFGKGNHLGI